MAGFSTLTAGGPTRQAPLSAHKLQLPIIIHSKLAIRLTPWHFAAKPVCDLLWLGSLICAADQKLLTKEQSLA